MSWQPLSHFRDSTVPKLNNLRRAAAAGLRVPTTWWLPAADAVPQAAGAPPTSLVEPLILRSGSPTEDTRHTSNAGQLLSLVVRHRDYFAAALASVVEAMPCDAAGRRLGVVFAQPLIQGAEAGVAFFDGFYYEQTRAVGSNEALTSGQQRGEVRRGQCERSEPWSMWLRSLYAVFGATAGGDLRLDVEFARDAQGYMLLQVRPALFALTRNPTLTLANHKETLGEHPSPFIVSAMVEAGRDLSFLCALNPACRSWQEVYAVELAGQAWLNLSLWLRWMDHFGLPRTLATAGIGGDLGHPDDAKQLPDRFWRSVPRLFWQQWLCLQKVRAAEKDLKQLDATIDRARDLPGLYAATVQGFTLGLSTNFAIAALCSAFAGVRRTLHIPNTARLVTQDMMEAHRRLFALPESAQRAAGLDDWLKRYGHRGPLESDLAQPRFVELREVLWQDLQAAPRLPQGNAVSAAAAGNRWLRLFSWIDERREWFRDQNMRRWQRLRTLLLAEGKRLVDGGELERADDVFWLHRDDLAGQQPLRKAVAAAKERAAALRELVLPLTATREQLEALLAAAGRTQAAETGRRVFPGIALSPAVVEGRAVRAESLTALLTDGLLGGAGGDVILVVPSLEPSWAVVFPRVAGVVAEVGGELSHASILLREAGRPAVVNCAGIFRQVQTGDRLRLDGGRALVELLDIPELPPQN